MGKNKFGIADILNAKTKAAGVNTVSEYTEIWLSPYDVKPSEKNFYSKENIEELADSFLAVGQQQPTVLGRVNGEFRIVSGHRRNLANIMNLERGHEGYAKVRYLYKDMTEAMLDLSLLIGNAYNRELTAWEKTQQAQRLKEALLRAKEEDGLEVPGKLRDIIAELMNESPTNIARMDSINNNATPEIKEEFAKGTIGVTTAYEAAKLPPEEQKAIAEKAAAGDNIRAKEIAAKVAEKTAAKAAEDAEQAYADWEKQQEESDKEIEKAERKREEAEEKAKAAQVAAQHAKVLREWVKESVSAATKAAADAVLKVSETDMPQKDWNNTEWVVFTARAIMQQADKVSVEDLYLLHNILMRCEKPNAVQDDIPGQMNLDDCLNTFQAGDGQTASDQESGVKQDELQAVEKEV